MLSKTVLQLSRSTSEMINIGVDKVRGLTWAEVRDLVRFARRRLREEKLPQVAGSLTFTTMLALVPLLTIVLAIFTTFPMFGQLRTSLDDYFVQMRDAEGDRQHDHLEPDPVRQQGDAAVGGGRGGAGVDVGRDDRHDRARLQPDLARARGRARCVQRVLMYWALVTLGPLLFGLSLTLTSQLFRPPTA